jgi:hypothetical protein
MLPIPSHLLAQDGSMADAATMSDMFNKHTSIVLPDYDIPDNSLMTIGGISGHLKRRSKHPADQAAAISPP